MNAECNNWLFVVVSSLVKEEKKKQEPKPSTLKDPNGSPNLYQSLPIHECECDEMRCGEGMGHGHVKHPLSQTF